MLFQGVQSIPPVSVALEILVEPRCHCIFPLQAFSAILDTIVFALNHNLHHFSWHVKKKYKTYATYALFHKRRLFNNTDSYLFLVQVNITSYHIM